MVECYGELISHSQVLRALHDFDREYPNTNEYRNWLNRGNYQYAVEHDGKLYPPKKIMRDVLGIPESNKLHGGKPTNRCFERLGFCVIRKP